MGLLIGERKEFDLIEQKSEFTIDTLATYFCDSLASQYLPIVYGGDYANPPPYGIYYRILYDEPRTEYCIQYFLYWLEQNCLGRLPLADHKFDYEPILIYLSPPERHPIGIVSGGYSKYLGPNCRFHKTEIRRKDILERDSAEDKFEFKTSPSPYYPFGGQEGVKSHVCIKKYPMVASVYFEDTRPLFGIISCSHVFSGADKDIKGHRLGIEIKQLDDEILQEWYNHNGPGEEIFGHDISNPFEFPYIKYYDPTRSKWF